MHKRTAKQYLSLAKQELTTPLTKDEQDLVVVITKGMAVWAGASVVAGSLAALVGHPQTGAETMQAGIFMATGSYIVFLSILGLGMAATRVDAFLKKSKKPNPHPFRAALKAKGLLQN